MRGVCNLERNSGLILNCPIWRWAAYALKIDFPVVWEVVLFSITKELIKGMILKGGLYPSISGLIASGMLYILYKRIAWGSQTEEDTHRG